jgi:hypothetical protein
LHPPKHQSVNDLENEEEDSICASVQKVDASDECIAILHWFWLAGFRIDEQE